MNTPKPPSAYVDPCATSFSRRYAGLIGPAYCGLLDPSLPDALAALADRIRSCPTAKDPAALPAKPVHAETDGLF